MKKFIFILFFAFFYLLSGGGAVAQPDPAAQKQRTEEVRKARQRDAPAPQLTPAQRREVAVEAAENVGKETAEELKDVLDPYFRRVGLAFAWVGSFIISLAFSSFILILFSGMMFKRWELILEGIAYIFWGWGLIHYEVLTPLGIEDWKIIVGVILPGIILIMVSFVVQDTWAKFPLVYGAYAWVLLGGLFSLWALVNRLLTEGYWPLVVIPLALILRWLIRRGRAAESSSS